MTLEFHPLANLFPLLEGAEFDAFVADIKANGLREPIELHEEKILDGRNRYRACIAAGLFSADDDHRFPSTDGVPGMLKIDWFIKYLPDRQGEPLAYVLSKNLARRHLNESQRAMVAARLATLKQGEANKGSRGAAEDTGDAASPRPPREKIRQADAAHTLAISERSLRTARAVQEKGTPELIAAVDGGKIAVSLAAQAAKLPVEQQQAVLAIIAEGKANAVRTVVKREARAQKEQLLAGKQRALPKKKYGVVLADPEWRFEPRSRETGLDRAPDNHYPTSKTIDICARPVRNIAATDCVLFLWATPPMLTAALQVMDHWGFTYRTHCIWLKDRPGAQHGTGFWFYGEHELLLLGTRGNVPAPAPGAQWRSVIIAPVGDHSEKPERFYELIESYFPNLPKIELNARGSRVGWDAWGNEAPDSNTVEGSNT
ncbi:MAG TPA: MT-A70 family methyltransferase [Rhizomicrobium sp.]|jgi:N6-adenosine-specific RNA methylase IME4